MTDPIWWQREIELPPFSRGYHLVTDRLVGDLPVLDQVQIGFLHLFILHTSASLTINENADPDVLADMELALNRICPQDLPFTHTVEGPDDMPAHVKASLMGSGLTIPIRNGRLILGTWQGVYLCEHRDRGGPRRVIATLFGTAANGSKR